MDAASLFNILSDESRRAILLLLLRGGEQCVCNLYAPLNMSQPKASRHLAVMREAGLVVARREGKWIHYRLNPAMPLWCYRILEAMRDGCPEPPPLATTLCPAPEGEGAA
jgi:ArsR family transcriptional regulator, arsenate/arsenite/antimonite-responsive transcriptional repressor